MAIVTRRYERQQPGFGDAVLNKVVQIGSSVKSFSATTVDIDINDNIDGFALGLDEFMSNLGYAFNAAAVPIAPGAVQEASLFSSTLAATSSATFVDAFGGSTINPPSDGNYLVIFEAILENSTAAGVGEIGVSKNSTTVAQADSDRTSQGPAGAMRSALTTVKLTGLVVADDIGAVFRKSSGAGTIAITERRLTMIKVQ